MHRQTSLAFDRSHRCLIAKYLQFPWNFCGEKDILDQDFPVNIDSSERGENTFWRIGNCFFRIGRNSKERVIIQSHSNIDFMLVLEPHTSTLRTMGIQLLTAHYDIIIIRHRWSFPTVLFEQCFHKLQASWRSSNIFHQLQIRIFAVKTFYCSFESAEKRLEIQQKQSCHTYTSRPVQKRQTDETCECLALCTKGDYRRDFFHAHAAWSVLCGFSRFKCSLWMVVWRAENSLMPTQLIRQK